MGDIGKVGKDGLGGSNSDHSLPTLIENALQGDSEALHKLLVEFEEPLKELAGNDGVSETTGIESLVKETKELVEHRIQKASVPDQESKERKENENKYPIGYPEENPTSPVSFLKWLKICYFDKRIELLSKECREPTEDSSSRRANIEEKLRVEITKFFWEKIKCSHPRQSKIVDYEDIIQEGIMTVWGKLVKGGEQKSKFDPKKGTFLRWTNGIIGKIRIKLITKEAIERRNKEKQQPSKSISNTSSDDNKLKDDSQSVTRKIPVINHPPEPKDPGKMAEELEEYLLLLRIICQHTRYPHKQFAFLFSHVIEGDNGRGNPLKVVQKYSEILFDGPTGETEQSLYQTYKSEYCRQTMIFDKDVLFEHCLPLEYIRSKLYKTVYENVKVHGTSVKTFRQFLEKPTALTKFSDYLNCYNEEPNNKIAEWCNDIKDETREFIISSYES